MNPSRHSSSTLPECVVACFDAAAVSLNGTPVLKETSWCLKKGESWLLTGANGAGKTTLLKALAGKLPICRGAFKTRFSKPLSQAVSLVSFDREQRLIAKENEEDWARYFSGSSSEGTRVEEYLAACPSGGRDVMGGTSTAFPQVHALRKQPLRSLSTGELRMVMITAALNKKPELLLLDEPFEGLDRSSRNAMSDLLKNIDGEAMTLVVATHRVEALPSRFNRRIHLEAMAVTDIEKRIETSPCDEPLKTPVLGSNIPAASETLHEALPVIEMHRVTVSYGKRQVLSNLDWTVTEGQNWHITGPNGSGKSTLVSLVYADNVQAYSNDIRLFGKQRGSGESIWEIKARMGYVSHGLQMAYRKDISALRVVISGFFDSTGLYRSPTGAQKFKAETLTTRMGIDVWKSTRFTTLSTGQQRLVLIARALVKNPEILILDEVCYGLDRANRKRILSVLETLCSGPDTTLLYITHHEDEIPECMTHRLELPEGKTTLIRETLPGVSVRQP